MNSLQILSIVGFIILAGCSAVPFGEQPNQEEPVPVVLENNATLTETFEVSVAKLGENITVHFKEKETTNYTIGEGGFTLKATITRIELPDSARIHGQYTLEPGERKQTSIENFPRDAAVVIAINDEDEGTYRALQYASCSDSSLLGVKASTQSEGEDESIGIHECG